MVTAKGKRGLWQLAGTTRVAWTAAAIQPALYLAALSPVGVGGTDATEQEEKDLDAQSQPDETGPCRVA